MRWTPNKPTEIGWYWFRSYTSVEQVVRVCDCEGTMRVRSTTEISSAPLRNFTDRDGAEWAKVRRPRKATIAAESLREMAEAVPQ